MGSFEKFEPSAELATLIRRNATALRSYFDDLVREWSRECRENPIRTLPVAGPQATVGATDPSPNGRPMCDCHAVTRSSISSGEAKIVYKSVPDGTREVFQTNPSDLGALVAAKRAAVALVACLVCVWSFGALGAEIGGVSRVPGGHFDKTFTIK